MMMRDWEKDKEAELEKYEERGMVGGRGAWREEVTPWYSGTFMYAITYTSAQKPHPDSDENSCCVLKFRFIRLKKIKQLSLLYIPNGNGQLKPICLPPYSIHYWRSVGEL